MFCVPDPVGAARIARGPYYIGDGPTIANAVSIPQPPFGPPTMIISRKSEISSLDR